MEKHPILLIDNFDSFTYNIVDYLAQAGMNCEIYRNNVPLQTYMHRSFSGVLLSPGPESPQKAGVLMAVLDYYARRLPILGICLGHQAIGTYFGYPLVKALKPMHGKVSVISCSTTGVFQGIPEQLEVVRYHSLILKDHKTDALNITAHTDTGEIMGIAHQNLPIWGIQFHPEAALTQYGHQMMANWVKSL